MKTLSEHFLRSLGRVFLGKRWYAGKGYFRAEDPTISSSLIQIYVDESGIVCNCWHVLRKRNGHHYVVSPNLNSCPPWPMNGVPDSTRFTVVSDGQVPLLALHDEFLVPVLYPTRSSLWWHFDLLEERLNCHLHQIYKHRELTTRWYREIMTPPNRTRH